LLLCYIRSRFTNIQEVKITIEEFKISDEALFDAFTCLFWKNEFLERINLLNYEEGLFEKSVLYLANQVLNSVQRLTEFCINFIKPRITSKAYNALSQSLSKKAENLTKLIFDINCDSADQSSLQNLFVNFSNLQVLSFFSTSEAMDDEVLNRLSLNTLPEVKKLKHFEFFIEDSSVTDLSVKKFFGSFPQEWFLTLEHFSVDLSGTKITNESLREFIDQILPKFQNLKVFDLYTEKTAVTSFMERKISQWKPSLTGEVKTSQ